MVVQEIRSTKLDEVLEFAKNAAALGLPFTLKAEVQTETHGEIEDRHLFYTLCIAAAPRGAVSHYRVWDCWRVE